MKHVFQARYMGLFVALTGVLVMAGWVFDIQILKSILPTWVTMKFATALSFLLSGLTLYYICKVMGRKSEMGIMVIIFTTLGLALLMGMLLISNLTGSVTQAAEIAQARYWRRHVRGWPAELRHTIRRAVRWRSC